MGAFSEDPEHFLKWARRKGVRADRWDFLPRRLYRDYILDLIQDALHARTDAPLYEHLCAEVMDVELKGSGVRLHTQDARSFDADKAVLALGNFPPPHPQIENRSALQSARYVHNPWDLRPLDSLSRRETVFLIGTGQTTVDIAAALYRRSYEGHIIAISRRGLLPIAHRGFETYPSFATEIKEQKAILDIFRIVRKHVSRAEQMGVDRRAVIDSLRPDTQMIWMNLPDDEKRWFLRHVFRYWEIIRSRIPPESEAIIDGMRTSGQMEIVAGRVRNLVDIGVAIQVQYVPRGRDSHEVRTAALVINCMGPESDYRWINSPLVKNLLRRGLIRPGPAHLGIDALPDGSIIGQNGALSHSLYTLGSPMKGVLWEVLAVPEIRVQAVQLARILESR